MDGRITQKTTLFWITLLLINSRAKITNKVQFLEARSLFSFFFWKTLISAFIVVISAGKNMTVDHRHLNISSQL